MAVYIDSRRQVSDPSRPYGVGEIFEYLVDTLDDIEELPGVDAIATASKAFVIATGDVAVLTKDGWRVL